MAAYGRCAETGLGRLYRQDSGQPLVDAAPGWRRTALYLIGIGWVDRRRVSAPKG